jgi:hypothetical protein
MHWFRTFEQYAMKESTILFDTFFNLLNNEISNFNILQG